MQLIDPFFRLNSDMANDYWNVFLYWSLDMSWDINKIVSGLRVSYVWGVLTEIGWLTSLNKLRWSFIYIINECVFLNLLLMTGLKTHCGLKRNSFKFSLFLAFQDCHHPRIRCNILQCPCHAKKAVADNKWQLEKMNPCVLWSYLPCSPVTQIHRDNMDTIIWLFGGLLF